MHLCNATYFLRLSRLSKQVCLASSDLLHMHLDLTGTHLNDDLDHFYIVDATC